MENTWKIGDIAICVKVGALAGLPEIKAEKGKGYSGAVNSNGNFTPKTGFVVAKTS